jgi:Ca2+-binding EF-hand superfamily protein
MATDEISQEEFDNAFVLMDNRGCQRLELATVYQFVDTLDHPPDHKMVKKVYDEFDEDGSGDIDREEFLGLCRALQKLTKVSVREMVRMYTNVQYNRLFDLVYVDDNKGGDRTINKKEVKIFFDQCASLLSVSAADVGKLLKEYPEDVLDFDRFSALIAKLIKGKSISQVVHAFEEAKRMRLAARKKAYETFEGSSGPVKRGGGAGTPAVNEEPAKKSGDLVMETTTDMNVFAEAFALMDSRGGGVLSLDNVYEFCEALPEPPSQTVVRKLYNQFDADGSGDIDSDEFLGFCQALEQAVGSSVQDMLRHFTKAMYKRLFELVDEGGDGNAMVSKDELKMLLEAISPMLSSKYSANDVLNLIRDYPGELTFDDFCDVVKKLTVGKSITQVVTAFEEAKRRRKAAKHYAMSRFEQGEKKSGLVIERGGGEGGQRSAGLCFMCVEKDEQIRELQNIITEMESGKDIPRSATVSVLRRDDDEPRGNPWEELHSLNRVVATSSWLRKYPEYVKSALHHYGASRILEMAAFYQERARGAAIDTDAVARTVNDAMSEHKENVDQLRAVADVCMLEIREFHRHAEELLQELRSPSEALQRDKVDSLLTDMSVLRERCQAMRGDSDWLIDSLSQRRSECSTKAFTVAPYTNKSQKMVQAVVDTEQATQQLLDMGTVLNMYGSDQLFDIEIFAKRILSGTKPSLTADEIVKLSEGTQQTLARLTPNDWNDLFTKLDASMQQLSKNASTSHSTRKEKAIMTQPVVDLTPLQRISKKGTHDDPTAQLVDGHTDSKYVPNVRMRSSSPPRIRQIRPARPRDAVAHVDKIVQDYVLRKAEDAPPLPSNFQRVEAGSNTFFFGTKKIEAIPVDKFACVKVGGGYLMFDEFCRKYAQQEARRFDVRDTLPTPRFDASTSAGGIGTPRSYGGMTPRGERGALSGTTPRTPRTMVRRPGGSIAIV